MKVKVKFATSSKGVEDRGEFEILNFIFCKKIFKKKVKSIRNLSEEPSVINKIFSDGIRDSKNYMPVRSIDKLCAWLFSSFKRE